MEEDYDDDDGDDDKSYLFLEGFFFIEQRPLLDHGLFIIDISPSHLDTPNSVGLLWTSDQPEAGTST
jgi:hypothetical protein